MKFWNTTLKNMKEYIPGEQPENISEYIKLNTNENPFPASKLALEAIMKHTEKLNRYPEPTSDSLRQVFAQMNDIGINNIFTSNGSDEIFTLIFRGFADKKTPTAFPYPSYSLYDTIAEACDIPYEKVNLKKNFEYNLNDFLKKKYQLVIITNPNNPTGTWCDVQEIDNFLSKFKGLLVVDEAYIDFYGGSALPLIKKYDNIIVTRSFSKSYSLAGLRIGIAAAHADIIRGFLKLKDSYNLDSLAIAGAAAALKDTKTFNYNVQLIKNNKEYLEEVLGNMGFTIIPSQANFLFVKHPKHNSEKLYTELKNRKILVRYFKGEIQSEYIRITVGTMTEIKQLCTELKSILKA